MLGIAHRSLLAHGNGAVASRMIMYKGAWRSGSQCQGTDGGGKDRIGGWMGQKGKDGDYEGMKGDGESIATEERQRTDEDYQPRDLQRHLRSSTWFA